MSKRISFTEIQTFAAQVERLCDFLLRKVGDDSSSDDVKAVQELREDAADIQFASFSDVSLDGLDDYMRGMPPKE